MNREFAWGVATSAYQIEGGRYAGGKGDSIWDRFSDLGRLADPGDIACDHYHRWEEDLDLLAALGVTTYRFSTAWARVIPDGDGEVNRPGLSFYADLLAGMLERGIEPSLTLYHWDLPQALQDKGGWGSRDTIDAFARYAGIMAESLGDKVGTWITHNEPWVSAFLGHLEGVFAPGLTDWTTALTAGHHMLVSHGRATRAIREALPGASIGLALDCRPSTPADAASTEANRHFDGFRNRWFFDPVFGLGYPQDMVAAHESRGRLPKGLAGMVMPGDLEEIAAPIDFLGVNYYTTIRVASGAEERDDPEGPSGPGPPPGYTEMGWRIDPAGLGEFIERVNDDYSPASIVITENGASYSDAPGPDGRIHDGRRIEYLEGHIAEVTRCRRDGIPVDGYFVWSLMDNLEWVQGFSQRFGLVWVDHATQERIPKDSYYWYRDSIAAYH
ncbi:MAG TPA: GH1 family beta-glucosidase [Acidimicrobiia bacterium]